MNGGILLKIIDFEEIKKLAKKRKLLIGIIG